VNGELMSNITSLTLSRTNLLNFHVNIVKLVIRTIDSRLGGPSSANYEKTGTGAGADCQRNWFCHAVCR